MRPSLVCPKRANIGRGIWSFRPTQRYAYSCNGRFEPPAACYAEPCGSLNHLRQLPRAATAPAASLPQQTCPPRGLGPSATPQSRGAGPRSCGSSTAPAAKARPARRRRPGTRVGSRAERQAGKAGMFAERDSASRLRPKPISGAFACNTPRSDSEAEPALHASTDRLRPKPRGCLGHRRAAAAISPECHSGNPQHPPGLPGRLALRAAHAGSRVIQFTHDVPLPFCKHPHESAAAGTDRLGYSFARMHRPSPLGDLGNCPRREPGAAAIALEERTQGRPSNH